jgi:predicted RNase H-like HicB family nuclease
MRYTIKELMEDGDTYEEADARLSRWAEEQADAERDRRMLEEFERIKKSRALEDFDGRA